ncbi:MAG: hypothetical protein F6J86_04945 [Symploca sp. SIO1B1]|nr:hypothetical protein [Symploca sp. SIO1C2]NER45177.1 hypothetical protein [Symploca sp. SIO1A3]NER93176.1 hypothetical protein [Symploca sp. SIO1B1]
MNKFQATEGRRVAQEIVAIREALKKSGYRIRKQPKQPSWTVYVTDDKFYLLTYKPYPISDWVLQPQDNDACCHTLLNLIQRALSNQPETFTREIS